MRSHQGIKILGESGNTPTMALKLTSAAWQALKRALSA
jgi:hypothetical protein